MFDYYDVICVTEMHHFRILDIITFYVLLPLFGLRIGLVTLTRFLEECMTATI